jgi:hypothetical protein
LKGSRKQRENGVRIADVPSDSLIVLLLEEKGKKKERKMRTRRKN